MFIYACLVFFWRMKFLYIFPNKIYIHFHKIKSLKYIIKKIAITQNVIVPFRFFRWWILWQYMHSIKWRSCLSWNICIISSPFLQDSNKNEIMLKQKPDQYYGQQRDEVILYYIDTQPNTHLCSHTHILLTAYIQRVMGMWWLAMWHRWRFRVNIFRYLSSAYDVWLHVAGALHRL